MEVASGNPLRHAHTHTTHSKKTVVYIIKKRQRWRRGVRTWWTKKYKKSVRSFRIIRFFALIMPPHAWGLEACETRKSFFIFPPQHTTAWWKIFRVYSFLFVSRLRCVIKRFGYMFRQVRLYIYTRGQQQIENVIHQSRLLHDRLCQNVAVKNIKLI